MNPATISEQLSNASSVPIDVITAIEASRSPIVISHIVPDADALGSMLAVALGWTDKGRIVKASIPESSLSQKLTFMRDHAGVPIATKNDFERADAFIVLDTARKDRCNVGAELRESDWSRGRPIINIDHHATNTRFGNVNWIVDHASSSCELAYLLLRHAERPITPMAASLLYAGTLTDTLGFSLPTTSPDALRAAADLVEIGADVADLGERLFRSHKQSEFDLLRVIYANTKRVGAGRIAYSSASYDEIHNAGCKASDIDDQITVPRSLDGVQLAMLFSEGRPGKTRINFRGSGTVTVLKLAQQFGGGGHAQAAGAILDCGLQEAIDRVIPKAVEFLNDAGNS
ncbi:MAG: DHH family phosphoesterase [Planctomycetes bacterium]|nr:DHH family phosphoesterase [Planctomycetota bacterium]MBI3835478.1 DHH family phosphoesterase [Planctomycetota bacterium]